MDKDLHSQKVDDWNLAIHDRILYFTYIEGDKLKIRDAFWMDREDQIKDVEKRSLPVEIMVNEGVVVFQSFSNGEGYSYNSEGKMVAKRLHNGKKVYYGWDRDRLIYYSDPDGNEYSYKYDEKGRLTDEKRPGGYENHYKYDEEGKMIWQSFGNGVECRYDDKGREIWHRDSDGETEFDYDEKGRLIWRRDANGGECFYKYYYDSRVLWKKRHNGVETIYE